MENLIKALQIFLKYANPEYPFHCEHDVLYVDVDPNIVSVDDRAELSRLGFISAIEGEEEYDNFVADGYDEGFISYKYGSC